MPNRYKVEIKLKAVTFTPTWQINGEETKHTVLANSYIDIEALPEKTQKQLQSIIHRAYIQHLKEKYG
jgi:hypothetical protein